MKQLAHESFRKESLSFRTRSGIRYFSGFLPSQEWQRLFGVHHNLSTRKDPAGNRRGRAGVL